VRTATATTVPGGTVDVDPVVAGGVDALGHPGRLRAGWVVAGVAAVVGALVLGVAMGPASLPLRGVVLELLDHLPGIAVDSGLSERQADILWELRMPRALLGLLVGALLSLSGASYQGVFRNPLADPWTLGAAGGAGLGATLVIAYHLDGGPAWVDPVPLAAFVGAILAVVLTYALGTSGGMRSTASLLVAGVAVAAFMSAVQTFVQQRNIEDIRDVYSWLLGRLNGSNWHDVRMLVPYGVASATVLLLHRRVIDIMAVGDEEAAALGLHPARTRLVVVIAATLATAAAVAVSGLIAFVGIIVPHTIRLVVGSSNRIVLPLSVLFGGAFLCLADVVARTALDGAELPIGVITAFFGAPFFVLVLRTSRRAIT
jgi:iron complex transport system permease protein